MTDLIDQAAAKLAALRHAFQADARCLHATHHDGRTVVTVATLDDLEAVAWADKSVMHALPVPHVDTTVDGFPVRYQTGGK